MAQSPDGRIAPPGSAVGYQTTAPDGIQVGFGWGVWVPGPTNQTTQTFSWQWLPMPGPPAPTDGSYQRSTPSVSQSAGISGPAMAPPVQFSGTGVSVSPPGNGQPVTVAGNAGSTGNPTVDLNRQVAGQLTTQAGVTVLLRNPA